MTDAERELLLALAEIVGPAHDEKEPSPFKPSLVHRRWGIRDLVKKVMDEQP